MSIYITCCMDLQCYTYNFRFSIYSVISWFRDPGMMAGYISDASSESELAGRNEENASHSSLSTIPDHLIPRAKEIHSLILNHNEFLLIPQSIYLFGNLLTLDLSNNHLTDIPKELTTLKNLRTLIVKSNGLTCSSIPKDFGLLSSLEVLNFSGNMFEVFPPQFTELSQLKYLYLGGNCITEMPNSIKNLQRLVSYSVHSFLNNFLSFTISWSRIINDMQLSILMRINKAELLLIIMSFLKHTICRELSTRLIKI